jgi:hypothetical protein
MIDGKIVRNNLGVEAGASAGGFVDKVVSRKCGADPGYIGRSTTYPDRRSPGAILEPGLAHELSAKRAARASAGRQGSSKAPPSIVSLIRLLGTARLDAAHHARVPQRLGSAASDQSQHHDDDERAACRQHPSYPVTRHALPCGIGIDLRRIDCHFDPPLDAEIGDASIGSIIAAALGMHPFTSWGSSPTPGRAYRPNSWEFKVNMLEFMR